jgi:hypothetical protein
MDYDKIILNSKDSLTQHLQEKGIYTWGKFIDFLRNIPYGRNSDRINISLVITERTEVPAALNMHSLNK